VSGSGNAPDVLFGVENTPTIIFGGCKISKQIGIIMNTQTNQTPNGVYLFNPTVNSNQLFEVVSACLCKAHALSTVAATTDFEAYDVDILNNYLWAISDLLRETRWLYGKIYKS
jgi:hypothetical protein